MKEQNENYKEKIKEILKNTEEYEDYEIDYIFINDYKNNTLTYASVDDNNVRIISNLENGHNIFDYVEDWDFGFDKDFFENLEKYWEIDFISDKLHFALWNYINEYYPDDIDSKNGVQVYLQYCVDNEINKEFFKEKGYNYVPDVMQYFNGLGLQETMNYKGWIIEADDVNPDNPKENLVNIYNTKEDYNKKIPNETISLNTINLRDNIANYIDNNYISKIKNSIDEENSYYTFVLGYDLLNEEIRKSPSQECDLTYDFCSKIANDFINSNYYKDTSHSAYEMLGKYVADNKITILREYEEFIGSEKIYFNDNKILLATSKRKDQPVALIQWGRDNQKEFVVAINYEIKGNDISWGYGKYYDDIKSGTKEYEKIISRDNLQQYNVKERNHYEQDR